MRLVSMLFAALLAADGAWAQAPRPQGAGKPTRRMVMGTWQVVRTIGLDKELFEQPTSIAAFHDRFVVADGPLLQSFTLAGERQWRAGREGSGPGEFRAVRGLAADTAGNTLVYDDALERLTVFDRSGKARRTIALPSRTDRARFAAGGRYLLLNTASDTLSRVIDSAGAITGVQRLPDDLRSFKGLAREMASIVPVPAGYLVTFRWSSLMLMISPNGAVTARCSGVDSLGFPDAITRQVDRKVEGVRILGITRVDPRARMAVHRAALVGGQLIVEPSVEVTGRHVVDVYAGGCGRYVESRPFPFPATQIAGSGDLLVAMLDEPVPHVVVLRWARK